jgi:hypothetical protein
MRSMQHRITAEVARIAEANGLEAAETVETAGPYSSAGHWWIMDGFAARLVINFDMQPSYATIAVTGPAADHAAEHDTAGRWRYAPAEDGDGCAYDLTIDYSRPDHFAGFFGLLGTILTPWQTTAHLLKELGALRAALLDYHESDAARETGDAMRELSGGRRAAAAEHLDDALRSLPAGSTRARQAAGLADALSAPPAALTAA